MPSDFDSFRGFVGSIERMFVRSIERISVENIERWIMKERYEVTSLHVPN